MRPASLASFLASSRVSIHAPLRGATFRGSAISAECTGFNPRTPAGCDQTVLDGPRRPEVSIHAPLRGATVRTVYCTLTHPTFQSTHPCGVRLSTTWDDVFGDTVSIHAPLRGATIKYIYANASSIRVSIHAPLRGATFRMWNILQRLWFQSTHPCGVRLFQRQGFPESL